MKSSAETKNVAKITTTHKSLDKYKMIKRGVEFGGAIAWGDFGL